VNLRIDRLDLDLRGIHPPLAEAAVRLLGPALQAALARADVAGAATAGASPDAAGLRTRVDAGRIAPAADAPALAQRLAERIAGAIAPGRQER
jgi:hypothetical protein